MTQVFIFGDSVAYGVGASKVQAATMQFTYGKEQLNSDWKKI